MASKKEVSPRKLAKQERSKFTVDAILEAATRIFRKSQLTETSTNKIAELAGVSIGTLYQYFPNKESLAVSLIDLHLKFIQN